MYIMDYAMLLGVHHVSESSYLPSSPSQTSSGLTTLLAGKEDISPLSIVKSADGRHVYTIGIVNSYQCYNATKKLERFYKRFVKFDPAEGISCAPPDVR